MHKKYFNFVLPIIGAAVVVGSGFSAWVFSDEIKDVNTSMSGSLSITNVVGIDGDNIKATATTTEFQIILDQGGVGNAEANKGISVKDTSKSEVITKIDITLSIPLAEPIDVETAKLNHVTGNFAVAATLPTNFATYLSWTPDVSETFTAELNGEQNAYEVTKTIDFSNLTYADKPASLAEYEAMVAAFSGDADITLKVDFTGLALVTK